MNYFVKRSILAVIPVIAVLSGCTKAEELLPENPATPSASTPSITINGAYGVMAAVKSVSYTTVAGYTVPVEVNTAVAAFYSAPGASLVDAGTVTLENKALTKSSNNAYVYQTLTSPLSLSTINWNVSGSGAVPAIQYTYERSMPSWSGYEGLPSTLTRSAGITVTLGSSVSAADSVYVIVADYNNGYLLKRVGGSAANCTFSASDLSSLAAGQGMIQVVPWNYKKEDFGDKDYYFVNESAYTKMGITIN